MQAVFPGLKEDILCCNMGMKWYESKLKSQQIPVGFFCEAIFDLMLGPLGNIRGVGSYLDCFGIKNIIQKTVSIF